MTTKTFAKLVFVFLLLSFSQTAKSQIKFGVFADCQYCNCDTKGTRHYRNSLEKLQSCIHEFNNNNVAFVVGLGDLIDHEFSSFDGITPVLSHSKTEVSQVIGNHDLSVENEYFEKVPQMLKLDKTWYSFEKKGWRFIFLNGCDLTFQSNDPQIVEKAKALTAALKNEGKPNYHNWNGGIGEEQLQWMENELKKAQNSRQKVILFCHFPLLPYNAHSLWNTEEVVDILKKYDCVKCWMNGHNHAGNYTFADGIHFLNLKGMIETADINTFSVIKLSKKAIEVTGYGNEPQRTLPIN
ncbi:metallophosphoesterase [Maribellus sp. YY47]|uniref:metallophosphoesterase n=1 Tax=Maribellus sp. YY47 TaxID=2929486 RepID=UPI0020011A5A|nr:metallophosphoesterase [Maribellus sp. YY47]MCK3684314.1 metallophosphoesterase [Maribellus sp. YY47]